MNNADKLGQLLTKKIKHGFLSDTRTFTVEGNRGGGSLIIFVANGQEVVRDEQIEIPKKPAAEWERKFDKGLVFTICNATPKNRDSDGNADQVVGRVLPIFQGLAVAAGYKTDDVKMTYRGPVAGRNIHFTEKLSNDPYFYALIQRNMKEIEKALRYETAYRV